MDMFKGDHLLVDNRRVKWRHMTIDGRLKCG